MKKSAALIQQHSLSPITFSYKKKIPKGLHKETIQLISGIKQEPNWMRDFRLNAYSIFMDKSMPIWGADLSPIKFHEITYYISPLDRKAQSWEDIPEDIKRTYEQLGIPQAEQNYLAGVSAQLESEVIYEGIRKKLNREGVIFTDTDCALKKYPEIFKEYFGKLVPPGDNKFSALNSAAWSGGSFIYVPKGKKVELPLQAYFLINARGSGQFERTLIIADEGSSVHYIEGCTAPIYTTASLHAAVVEVFVKKNASVKYTTVQNWSKSVYNLTTKRASVEENGSMEWIDANIGSKVTMKYPSCILKGVYAKGKVLSLAYATHNQHQDTGAKMIHLAPNTSSRIISKSISKDGGRTSYRGQVRILPEAKNSSVYVSCDAMILDPSSRSDTYPNMQIHSKDTEVQHEATIERIGEEKLYYLSSRGLSKGDAESLIINGFIDPVIKEIPMEYAVEMNRLVTFEMNGSVG
jgi:Fe-S cluster assembly protein SufB